MVQPAVQRAAVQPAVQRAAVQLLAWRAWSNNDNAYITYTTYMRRRTWKCQNLALDVHPHPQTSSADSDIPKFPDINLALNPCIHHKTYMIQQQPSVSQSDMTHHQQTCSTRRTADTSTTHVLFSEKLFSLFLHYRKT